MMGSSISGKSSHEADTKTTVGCGPGVGRGRRVRAEETFRGYASPAPSRCSLLYTSRTAPGADAERNSHAKRCTEVLDPPHPLSVVRRPELQGQAGFTQAVWSGRTDRLPGRGALAPALWRRGRALNRQGEVGTAFFHGMRVPHSSMGPRRRDA